VAVGDHGELGRSRASRARAFPDITRLERADGTGTSITQGRAVARHRARLERQGIVRLEVQVRKQGVPLLRGVVSALADPAREAETRALLRARFAPPPVGRKALLAAAPLEGIDLERQEDLGRAVALRAG
jgi:hypothetical protein